MIIFLAVSSLVHAKDIVPVKVFSKNKGIVVKYDDDIKVGSEIYVYDGKKLLGIAKVRECKIKTCKATYRKIRKKIVVTADHTFSTKSLNENNSTGSYLTDKRHLVYGSYGGAFNYGMQVGYLNELKPKFRAGGYVGLVNHEYNDVNLTSTVLALQADYRLSTFSREEIHFGAYGELGYSMGTIDFGKVGGGKADELAMVIGGGLILWKNYQNFSFMLKGGYAYNFHSESFTFNGVKLKTPFDGGLYTVELGVGYSF